jgi:catechol 2,3-dioxygenase-like lactoylglutathione lyase family enzyme
MLPRTPEPEADTIPPMPLVEAGPLHRLALAVDDATVVHEWFIRVLGAGALQSEDHPNVSRANGEADLAGADIRLFRVGGFPVILLSKGAPGGPVASFLERYGPGVHSLAWEVADMWATQNLLIERGIRIGAVNIPGRHFFMHPRDTRGLLMEWTDDTFGSNDRRPDEGGGVVDVLDLAWVTAIVADAAATAEFLVDLAGATPVSGNARGPAPREETIDLRVGDMTVRLVTPLSPESPYTLTEGRPGLTSMAYRVADLDASMKALADAGIPTIRHEDGLAATDSSTTCGLPIEWTA